MEHGKDVGRRASLEAVGVLCRDMAGVPQATRSVLRGTAWTQSSPVTRAPPPPLAVVFLLSSQALRWALPWPSAPSAPGMLEAAGTVEGALQKGKSQHLSEPVSSSVKCGHS